jgi:hypothetical protein
VTLEVAAIVDHALFAAAIEKEVPGLVHAQGGLLDSG